MSRGLPWNFEPEQTEIEIRDRRGHDRLLQRDQQSARTTTGQAAYNVVPLTVGAYFQKINCFCFTEQTHRAGRDARDAGRVLSSIRRSRPMPRTTGSTTITLSYTFYPVRDRPQPKPLAAGEARHGARATL